MLFEKKARIEEVFLFKKTTATAPCVTRRFFPGKPLLLKSSFLIINNPSWLVLVFLPKRTSEKVLFEKKAGIEEGSLFQKV